MAAPTSSTNDTGFVAYCRQHGVGFSKLGCDAANWTAYTKLGTGAKMAATQPERFYFSMNFLNSAAIAYFGNITGYLRECGLDAAKFGANFALGDYKGKTFMWIRLSRERALQLR